MFKLRKILTAFGLLVLIGIFVYPAFAQTETSPTPRVKNTTANERIQKAREKQMEIKENIKSRASDAAARRAEKLSAARLRICQARANSIGGRLKSMHALAVNTHKGHEKRYQRVDEFYNNKLVSQGAILSNYAELKAEIEANKATVVALHESAKEAGLDFDCSSEDPKGQVDAFKDDMQALIDANKTYKQSIRNFVQAVRDLARSTKNTSISPAPSISPVPTEGGSE